MVNPYWVLFLAKVFKFVSNKDPGLGFRGSTSSTGEIGGLTTGLEQIGGPLGTQCKWAAFAMSSACRSARSPRRNRRAALPRSRRPSHQRRNGRGSRPALKLEACRPRRSLGSLASPGWRGTGPRGPTSSPSPPPKPEASRVSKRLDLGHLKGFSGVSAEKPGRAGRHLQFTFGHSRAVEKLLQASERMPKRIPPKPRRFVASTEVDAQEAPFFFRAPVSIAPGKGHL